jgi:hypothetical protein
MGPDGRGLGAQPPLHLIHMVKYNDASTQFLRPKCVGLPVLQELTLKSNVDPFIDSIPTCPYIYKN